MDLMKSVVVLIYAIVNTCGIVANLLVIILIYTSTPENLKRFSLLLLNMAVIDCIANCAGLFSIPSEMDFLESVVVLIYAVVNTCGIVANLLAIILIYTSTPENLKRFSLLLLNMAVIDCIANCAGLFSIPRYCTMMSLHIHSTLCLPISFFYRWWILSHPPPAKWRILLALASVLPLVSVEWTTCIRCLNEDMRKLTEKNEHLRSVDLNLLIGFSSIKNFFVTETMCYLSFVFPVVYCIVFVIRRNVLITLENTGLGHAAVAYLMHKKLLMVITLQAIVPFAMVFCSIQYFYIQLIDAGVLWMQYFSILPTNCLSCIQPLITLYFVAPYRKALSKVFGSSPTVPDSSAYTTTHATTVHTVHELQ